MARKQHLCNLCHATEVLPEVKIFPVRSICTPGLRYFAEATVETNTAAKRMRMRQLWHFRFAHFFLVSCLFSRKFYKV